MEEKSRCIVFYKSNFNYSKKKIQFTEEVPGSISEKVAMIATLLGQQLP